MNYDFSNEIADCYSIRLATLSQKDCTILFAKFHYPMIPKDLAKFKANRFFCEVSKTIQSIHVGTRYLKTL